MRIGLTGGIASGKSTVAEMFAALGVAVIDTDVIAREIVQPGEPALDEIRAEFGDQVILASGELDRTAMRHLVFADAPAREKLEAILHPRIRESTVEQAAAAGGEYQLIVVPLLAESPIRDFVDRILVVDCPEDVQIQRLLARDAESEEQARRMLAAQAGREQRLAIADDVILNDGDLEQARVQVEALHTAYTDLARQR
jgi:dephospho-CoA kinase